MSATVLSFFRPAPATSGDWSQQELAEFYRVEAASLQARLRLSLDRGLSDEGDPWLVFCREDGEVFLHFTRLDGSYVIVSDMLGEPLVGPDFRALLAELVVRNPSVLPINRETLAGTGRQGGAQILMHPAALLAAIVATTCLFSSMNEAVASELEGAPLSGDRHSGETVSRFDFDATSRHQNHDVVEGDTARSRASEQRELAVSTSVVMACIVSFLHQSSNETGPALVAKLTSTEALHPEFRAFVEKERMVISEAKGRDLRADKAHWIETQEIRGENSVNPESQTWLRPSPSEAGAILLALPGASVVTIGFGGPQALARGGPFEGTAPLHFVPLTSAGPVRLVTAHVSDLSSTTAKSSANVSSAETGNAVGSGLNTGAESGTPATAANEVSHQPEPSRPPSSAEKVLVSSSMTKASSPDGGNGIATLAPSPASGAELSMKLSLTASDDKGGSTIAQVKENASTASAGAIVSTATVLPSNTAYGKIGASAFQDLGILSAKTVSLFLHSLIGEITKVGVGDGATPPPGQQDIVNSTMPTSTTALASASSKVASGLTVTDAASDRTVPASANVKLSLILAPIIDKQQAPDHVGSDMPASEKGLVIDPKVPAGSIDSGHLKTLVESTPAISALALSTSVISTPATVVDTAPPTISGSKLKVGVVDADHATGVIDTIVAAKPESVIVGQGAALPTPVTAGTNSATSVTNASSALTISTSPTLQDVSSAHPADLPVGTIVDHTGALHAVAALVSTTNTVTKAVSLSLTTGAVSFDAVQLRIIDTFIASTPNLEFKVTDNTLEIFGPSAMNDTDSHVVTWDLGGGTFVKVIGIGDVGHFG